MAISKLDGYDYNILPGLITINLESTTDPILVDILSEIEKSNGNIYVEGFYYSYLGYEVYSNERGTFMELKVVEIAS